MFDPPDVKRHLAVVIPEYEDLLKQHGHKHGMLVCFFYSFNSLKTVIFLIRLVCLNIFFTSLRRLLCLETLTLVSPGNSN